MEFVKQGSQLLVIRALDTYTSGPARDLRLQVQVAGLLQKPIRKANGMFVFENVPPGSYTVQVASEMYHVESLQVDTSVLDPLSPVVRVDLIPQAAYPFDEEATLARANVRDEQNRPVADVRLRAIVTTESCAKARLGQDVEAGAREIALTRIVGRLAEGARYWLQDPEGALGERCVLAQVEPGARTVQLDAPLEHAYARGTLLLPLVEGRSDRRGEVVLGFGNYRTKRFEARLEFVSDEQQAIEKTVKEVSLQEGQMTGLGAIPIKVVG